MITSLSKYRLESCSKILKSLSDQFVILQSIQNKVVTQYYVVPSDWKSSSSRVEPVAHINKAKSGHFVFKTWQPETYQLKISKEIIIQEITH